MEKVAGVPHVKFPMFAAFDDSGRLYVAESSGGDLYKEISDQTRLCRIRLLIDRNRDGRFDVATLFADKLNFPMGLVWRGGKLYAADPPDLVTLEDTDKDGISDKRTVILTGFGHRDNGSLHGLTFGPDGWLYMTCGEPDGYRIQRKDGSILEGHNGALLRCRADGSDIEVLSRGFVNLVEVVFAPTGEIIGTDNWFVWPRGGVRDGLVHLVEGGLYPLHLKDVGTQHPVMGEPLPAISMFPAVALSGLAIYHGDSFPAEMHGNLFSAQHNSRKVMRHVLLRDGATFRTEDHEFLESDDPDFHPSDVLEAPDGSLVVLDTGSWYIHHCPTGRIRKSPAVGGIYRIRYKGGGPGTNRTDDAGALWHSTNLATVREALRNSEPDVVATAARVLGRRGDTNAAQELTRLLSASSAAVQMAAAEALAHCGSSASVPAIWDALTNTTDRFLEHALTYAAHRLATENQLAEALDHPSPSVQKAALTLLSQPPRPRSALSAETVLARMSSPDEQLRRTALRILQGRPEWVDAARKVFREGVASPSEKDKSGLRELVLAFQSDAAIQDSLAAAMAASRAETRRFAIELAGQTSIIPQGGTPESWATAFSKATEDSDSSVRAAAFRTVATLNITSLDRALEACADDAQEAASLRLEALRALIARFPKLSSPRLEFVTAQLRRQDDPLAPLAAAEILRRAHLTDDQAAAAMKAVRSQPVVSPSMILAGFRNSTTAEASTELLKSIEELMRNGWKPTIGELTMLFAKLPPALNDRVDAFKRLAEETVNAAREKLQKYEMLLRGGDPDAGREVFFSAKTACATCHAIGGHGGSIGPDLTKIGTIRSGRDILESIVLPSASFAQSYEPYTALTKDGREFTAMLARQTPDAILLRDATGQDIRVPQEDIRELRRLEVSVMPEGLESGLSTDEFRNLLAFLQSLK